MSEDQEVVLPPDARGRLDAVLAPLLPQLSRRALKAALREGRVRVDGRRARGSDPARPGASVVVLGDAAPQATAAGIRVVFEDAAMIAVDKPAGLHSAPVHPGQGPTAAGWVRQSYPDVEGVGDLPLAPGLCHRLDGATSGLLLFARTAAAFSALRIAFEKGTVEKVYLAVVDGRLEGEGRLVENIGRRRGRGRRLFVESDDGPSLRRVWPARTAWRSLRAEVDRSLLEVRIETGVTHQIRVHLSHLGHPVAGDETYGGSPGPRLGLHATRLSLAHPISGEPLTLESPPPDELLSLLSVASTSP